MVLFYWILDACLSCRDYRVPPELRLIIKEYIAVHELFTTGRLENSVKVYFNAKEPLDQLTIKLKYGPLTYWDVSHVTHMNNIFWGCKDFNESIEEWDVSNVITMDYMFLEATSFNQPLNNWNISNVQSMESMFSCAESFNQPLDQWDMRGVRSIRSMFYRCKSFNQPINNWQLNPNIDNIENLFFDAHVFNQPLDKWNVSKVKFMTSTFHGAESFNQPLHS